MKSIFQQSYFGESNDSNRNMTSYLNDLVDQRIPMISQRREIIQQINIKPLYFNLASSLTALVFSHSVSYYKRKKKRKKEHPTVVF